ncbi:MAG: glycosyltransferase [Bacteroidetes bacterium]|nr:glycosyltransferase [Bacteroidota bacterium]
MNEMLKIAGVTVLYQPSEEVILNILSYLNQIDLLYIIDNSEEINMEIIGRIREYDRIRILDNYGNIEIAAALNKAARKAIEDDYDFLLTMDQDTALPDNMVVELLNKIENYSKVGIISPYHNVTLVGDVTKRHNLQKDVLTVMTCGNLLNLEAYKEIGGFEEKLFIDYVDHEFCLRLNRKGYRVIQYYSVSILHKLGERKIKYVLFKRFEPTNHIPIRLYYRTRNRLFVWKKYIRYYPLYVFNDIIHFCREIISISLTEEKKLKKIKMILLGIRDFILGRYGKLRLKYNSRQSVLK